MSNNKAFKVKNGLELADYNKSISDTAVDVFVYDTRKDSDGGAWRKRTQHTSWYNETLNTATRGSRKEFPAVAVIVAESNQVTIYDGDDPDLPMWMVFDISAVGSVSISSTYAKNGQLLAGSNGVSGYLYSWSFPSVLRERWYSSSRQIGTGSFNAVTYVDASGSGIVSNTVNDVAMTVLPNAPIDAATGLSVPTIAVATAGGHSFILDNGNVVDLLTTTYTDTDNVSFTDKGRTYNLFNDGGFVSINELPSEDISSGSTLGNGARLTRTSSPAFSPDFSALGRDIVAKSYDEAAISTSAGLTNLQYTGDTTTSMVAYTTSDYATGWMNGDIKLATLSDTDDTDVTGSELVTNGTFDSDTDWTKQTGWSISSGVATFSGTDYNYITQDITTVVGETYVATVEITAITTGSVQLRIMNGATEIGSTIQTTLGTHAVTFVATGTTTTVRVYAGFSGARFAGSVDNVSVRLAEEDRSVNGNGLQVFGTVTKNPVATGADLVAYSGFTASNYFEQPYNSDLDFGTGDFCYMGWFKTSSNGITMFERCASPRSGNGMTVYMDGTGKPLWYKIVSGTPTIVVTPTAAYNNNSWVHFAAIRQNGVVSLYFNGQKDGSASDSTDMTNTSAIFRLGANATGTSGWTGSLALWRISATAPSPEQIARIYNDEKHLFTEDAQATLYGSSDAVTALAYDTDTELLHVGTSAGRSVFQGLRRVDNTTTAVTSAISASNGLVADE